MRRFTPFDASSSEPPSLAHAVATNEFVLVGALVLLVGVVLAATHRSESRRRGVGDEQRPSVWGTVAWLGAGAASVAVGVALAVAGLHR